MKTSSFLAKVVSLLTALVLLVSLTTSALATSVITIGETGEAETSPVISMTELNGKLYLLDESGNIAMRMPGEKEATTLGTVMISTYVDLDTVKQFEADGSVPVDMLFAHDGALYGVCMLSGGWYRLTDDTGAFAPEKQSVTLSSAPEGVESNMYQIGALFAQDGWLYISGTDFGTRVSLAYRVSLETGERKTFSTKALYQLAPWKDGLVGCFLYDLATLTSAASAGMQTVQFGLFDPESDAITMSYDVELNNALGGYAVSGLCSDGASLFYLCGSRIYGLDMQTGDVRTSAYTGDGMFGSSTTAQALCAGGYYLSTGRELRELPLDTDAVAKGALRIFGEFGSDPHNDFVKAHPEIPVDVGGDYTADLDKLTQAMLTEDDPYDVLLMNLSAMPVDRLIDKGYCLDLSQYPELTEPVSQMLPLFAEAGKKDGKLYGVPVNMSANTMSVNLKKWEELGLSKDDLPRSYSEFLDFFANWSYDYADEHSDIRLFSYGQARDLLFSLLINEYLYYPEAHGEKLRFDTPMFRKLMQDLSAVDFSEFEDTSSTSYYVPDTLFGYMTVSELGYYGTDEVPLPLALADDVEPAIPATVSVLIINPKTERLEQALAYVSYYVTHLDDTSANITMYPDHNEPIFDKQNQKAKAVFEEELAKEQERLESASEENKAEIRNNITLMQENIAQMDKYLYTVPAEKIAEYRETIQPLLYLATQGTLLSSSTSAIKEINAQLLQYLSGAIDLDTLVTSLDSRLMLMELEN